MTNVGEAEAELIAQIADPISLSIDEELLNLSPTPSEQCIFRVPEEIRIQNKKAYEPVVISIGPYHHGKKKLQKMEEHKKRYLKELLNRRQETSVDKYVKVLKTMEEKARKCYAEKSSLIREKFVRMMLLDGFFIIELLRKWLKQESLDDIFQISRIGASIIRDLMLLENQLPLFIILQLFHMTKDPNEGENEIGVLAYGFLGSILQEPYFTEGLLNISISDYKHLLHLVHDSMCASFARVASINIKDGDENEVWEFINCVTELQEAGIEFKKIEKSHSLFDIKFSDGSMAIPQLKILDCTEPVLRNLIAYEQFLPDIQERCVTDYIMLMDCLVNSAKDATLLRCCGIFDNYIGDDVAVCDMLNKLNKGASLGRHYCFANILKNVNAHCRRPWNTQMANLKHNYFNTPWASISVVAAVLLLLLTAAQTIFSALPFLK